MLSFPDGFFKDEEREEFYIDETMKRYWACCMDLVDVVDTICKKYGLTWYSDWGTLLGAARHKGFIPWDDDIDIALKRPDYEKLLSVLPHELPKGFKVSTAFNNNNHTQFFAGLSNGDYVDVSKERRNRFYGSPFVAFIDIFPIDYLPRNASEADLVKNLIIIVWNAVQLIKDGADETEIEKAVKDVEEYLAIKIDRNEKLLPQLWRYANLLAMSYGEEDGDELVQWVFYIKRGVKFDKAWYDDITMLDFENMKYPCPKNYDEVLTAMYGDWHKRVRGGQAHNYPVYGKQIEIMRRMVKEIHERDL